MTNLITDIERVVNDQPTRTAIGYDGQETSYEEFWIRTGRFAAALDEHGIGADDRVAVYLPNLPQFLVAFCGTLRAGGIVVPMNPQYKAREIGHLLADSGAKAVVTLADLVPSVDEVRDETAVERVVSVGDDAENATPFETFLADDTLEVVDRADADVAVQPYTSGTTGRSKGVLLTHSNLAFEASASPKVHDGVRPSDKMLGVLPLFHIYGMSVTMLATLYGGGSYYPMPTWDAGRTLDLVSEAGITLMHAVPAMYNDLVNHPAADEYDLSTVRFANAGGSSLPMEVMRRFEKLFEPDLLEGYGLTETAPVTHANRPDDRRPGSIGKPLPGVEAMIVDGTFEELEPVEKGPIDDEQELDDVVGELVIAGPNVMKGYYGLPEANERAFTERDGKRWFHTGDIGYHDADGFYYVVDREKHMIVTGGYNVYPREVEELLFEHEAVADATVVGIPDERRGETVKAYVVTTPDADVSEEEIKQYCLSNLAEYKHPRQVEFVEELPRTTTGKVQKFQLVEQETNAN